MPVRLLHTARLLVGIFAVAVLAGTFLPPAASAQMPPQGRASSHQVGAAMALLAVFGDAGILPPEGTPEANHIIKAVIQFQSAFLKSRNPAVRHFFTEAHQAKFGDRGPEVEHAFERSGWTADSFEAVVQAGLARQEQVWTTNGLQEGLSEFNIGKQDFEILADLYQRSTKVFTAQGTSLSEVYAARRREMPGAR
ncbi:MAG: hypothetical protein KF814_14000 [Nitrospiraceae bacterium]|nr:hypothetical protein [Nitrospiraceae bacterium]